MEHETKRKRNDSDHGDCKISKESSEGEVPKENRILKYE